jgi:hypothetical protein
MGMGSGEAVVHSSQPEASAREFFSIDEEQNPDRNAFRLIRGRPPSADGGYEEEQKLDADAFRLMKRNQPPANAGGSPGEDDYWCATGSRLRPPVPLL